MAKSIVLGVLASPGLAHELAEELAEDLGEALKKRHPDADWQLLVADEPFVGPTSTRELKEAARRYMREQGWDMAVVLTDLPLRSGRRPVTAHASAHLRVGLVSVPALGAVNLDDRVREAVLNVVDGMLGERVGRFRMRKGRRGRMGRRLEELSSPLGAARVKDEGTIRFTTAVVRGNLRLLAGMVRANNPSLVILRLSRALAVAGGTAAVSLSSVNVWLLADGSSAVRLAGVAVGTIVATIFALVVSHRLWETSGRHGDREQVILFNLATASTVLIGVVSFYLALVALSLACGYALIPPEVFGEQLGHPTGFGDHLQLSFLVASIATIGGALGSLTEDDFAVREAMYSYHPDARTEDDAADTERDSASAV